LSAALQIPGIWAAAARQAVCHGETRRIRASQVVSSNQQVDSAPVIDARPENEKKPLVSLAFYRKHTEALLRRYLYASMVVGRAPSLLDDAVARGWASSRPVRSFEDAVNFVLDVESCLARLSAVDRCLLSRIVLQEYTVAEAADMLRINPCTTAIKLSLALDRLTETFLAAGLLIVPR
jgi:hypothetical protein